MSSEAQLERNSSADLGEQKQIVPLLVTSETVVAISNEINSLR